MTTALLHLVAAALVVSGLDKLRAPRPATTALRTAGLGSFAGAERAPGLVVGVCEVVVGATAVATSHALAAVAVAVVYAGFAWFVLRLRRRDPSAGCGCFSATSAPPGPEHVAVDIGSAIAAAVAAVVGAVPASTVVADGIVVTVPYAALLVTGALLLLTGPALTSELRHLRSPATPRRFTIDTEAVGPH